MTHAREREIRTRLAMARRAIDDAVHVSYDEGVGERLEIAIVRAMSELTEAERLNNDARTA